MAKTTPGRGTWSNKNYTTKRIIIWRADCKWGNRETKKQEEKPRTIIGQRRKQEIAEEGNGSELRKIRYDAYMIQMDTWKQAPMTQGEKQYKIIYTYEILNNK